MIGGQPKAIWTSGLEGFIVKDIIETKKKKTGMETKVRW